MTIWILALVLLAAGAGIGFRQGAIRVAISFVGIVTAALCAAPLGHLLRPLFGRVGIQNPIVIWLLAPLIAFIIVFILFKVAGFFVHRKVYLFYKYQAGDLRLALWRRLNSRLGLSLGLLNGTTYLLLISCVIYNLSYWTIQIAPSSNESVVFRAINRMGNDLEATGLSGTARAMAPFSKMYYRLADLAGLLRQNPQLKKRLEDYPPFLSLVENDAFIALGRDNSFQSAWKNQAPIMQLLKNRQIMAMIKNTGLTMTVRNLIQSNWDDLETYLRTGESPKYDSEKILGRWNFDVDVSVGNLLVAHPKITAAEVKGLRSLWSNAYAQTTFIAAADHHAYLENLPRFKMENRAIVVAEKSDFKGQWENEGTNYNVSLDGNGQHKSATVQTDGLRLTLQSGSDSWVFVRE